MPNGSFPIYLNSNTKYPNNTTSKFTIPLANALEFNSQWSVRLEEFIYTHSWPSIGSASDQFIDIKWKDGSIIRLKLDSISFKTVEEFAKNQLGLLKDRISERSIEFDNAVKLALFQSRPKRSAIEEHPPLADDDDVVEEHPPEIIDDNIVEEHPTIIEDVEKKTKEVEAIVEGKPKFEAAIETMHRFYRPHEEKETSPEIESHGPFEILHLSKRSTPPPPEEIHPIGTTAPTPPRSPQSPEKKKEDEVLQTPPKTPDRPDPIVTTPPRTPDQKKDEEVLQTPPKTPDQPEPVVPTPPRTPETEKDDVLQTPPKTPDKPEPVVTTPPRTPEQKKDEEVLQTPPKTPDQPEPVVTTPPRTPEQEKDEEVLQTPPKTPDRPEPIATTPPRLQDHKERKRPIPKSDDELDKKRLSTDWKRQLSEQELNLTLVNFIQFLPKKYQVANGLYAYAQYLQTYSGDIKKDVRFNYKNDRVILFINNTEIEEISLSDQLAYTLGFENNTFSQRSTYAELPIDISGGIDTLFIYAPNLVQPSIVSDSLVPILRIVTIRSQPGQVIKEEFINPQLYSLMHKVIREISIEIRTSTGRLVPFKYGNCILNLVFVKDRFY